MKKGILLTMNPGAQMGWALVEAGRKSQAQTSEVSMARAVAPLNETKKIMNDLSGSFQTKLLVRKLSFLKFASGPKVSPNNSKTQTVLKIEFKVKTNLNRFSWSSWMKCSGWKNFKITKNIDRVENIIHLVNEEHPGEAEAEKGAQQLTGRPEQTDVQGCYKRGQWMLKGLETQDGSKLKNCTLLNLTFITEQEKL